MVLIVCLSIQILAASNLHKVIGPGREDFTPFRLYGLLDEAAERHEPIRITGRRKNAILINIQHRLVYPVLAKERTVRALRMFTPDE